MSNFQILPYTGKNENLESLKKATDGDNLPNLYAYGASLLLPIAFWYLPSLRKCLSILDANPDKISLKYVGIDIPIVYDDNIHFEDKSICVTALGTRMAHRKILSSLCSRNPKYIVSPFSTI